MVVIHKYLMLAIQYDYPFTMVKYCVQQLLGSLQDTAQGKSSLCSITDYPFTMVKYCVQQLLGSLQDTAQGKNNYSLFSH